MPLLDKRCEYWICLMLLPNSTNLFATMATVQMIAWSIGGFFLFFSWCSSLLFSSWLEFWIEDGGVMASSQCGEQHGWLRHRTTNLSSNIISPWTSQGLPTPPTCLHTRNLHSRTMLVTMTKTAYSIPTKTWKQTRQCLCRRLSTMPRVQALVMTYRSISGVNRTLSQAPVPVIVADFKDRMVHLLG